MYWNPNWAAFAAAMGCQPADLNPGAGTNAAFMGWLSVQATAFSAATGITKETHPGQYAEALSSWLTARTEDGDATTCDDCGHDLCAHEPDLGCTNDDDHGDRGARPCWCDHTGEQAACSPVRSIRRAVRGE